MTAAPIAARWCAGGPEGLDGLVGLVLRAAGFAARLDVGLGLAFDVAIVLRARAALATGFFAGFFAGLVGRFDGRLDAGLDARALGGSGAADRVGLRFGDVDEDEVRLAMVMDSERDQAVLLLGAEFALIGVDGQCVGDEAAGIGGFDDIVDHATARGD